MNFAPHIQSITSVQVFETELCRLQIRVRTKLGERESGLRKELDERSFTVDKSVLIRLPTRPRGTEQFSLLRIKVGSTQEKKAPRIQKDRESSKSHARFTKTLKTIPKINKIKA